MPTLNAGTVDSVRGTMKTLYAPMGVSSLSQDEILRAFEWYDNLASIDPKIQELSVIAFEFQVIVSLWILVWPLTEHV